ncbi:Os06g0127825 [Oryza sativa Japonica Group]|uniref:Os06g0127825 protein n=1 Tax=Oryza sativa subsp. japonica TaxID=39947 RepID=A0A0P0WSB8_ORYSJ|nr:hypothetical protein EE612_031682 [Oryza sativa]BAS95939.1 Os06g0127825 [Oryza sativa Japonica Group]
MGPYSSTASSSCARLTARWAPLPLPPGSGLAPQDTDWVTGGAGCVRKEQVVAPLLASPATRGAAPSPRLPRLEKPQGRMSKRCAVLI